MLVLLLSRHRASRSLSQDKLEELADPGVPRVNKFDSYNAYRAVTRTSLHQPAAAARETQIVIGKTSTSLAGEVNLAAAINRLYDEDERIKEEQRRHQQRLALAHHLML
jgi:hypothetical protein